MAGGVGFLNMTWTPGLGMVTSGLLGLGLDIRSNRVPLERSIRQVMIPSFTENFQVGGRPSWQPLAQVTIDTKQAQNSRYPAEKPLLRSGTLYKTVQQLNIWSIQQTEAYAVLPESVSYGNVHQEGTSSIPARPFMVFQTEDMDKIQEIFADWLLERALARLI